MVLAIRISNEKKRKEKIVFKNPSMERVLRQNDIKSKKIPNNNM
jgi:hypothetical protein